MQLGDKEAHATAKIPQPIILDSLWFLAYEAYDSLGFIWAKFTDPDTTGNCYRWFAQRINSYTYNYDPPYDNVIGTMKDERPLAPIGSSTDDKLFNGLTFDFAFPRSEDYILEVSTPGVDRKFFNIDQLNDYIGMELEFKTRELIQGKRKFSGILSKCDNLYFSIKNTNEPNVMKFKFTDIDLCKLKPNYNDLIKEYNHAK